MEFERFIDASWRPYVSSYNWIKILSRLLLCRTLTKGKEFYNAEKYLVYGTLDSVKILLDIALEWEESENCRPYFGVRFVMQYL
jgi:hypothetical protein